MLKQLTSNTACVDNVDNEDLRPAIYNTTSNALIASIIISQPTINGIRHPVVNMVIRNTEKEEGWLMGV